MLTTVVVRACVFLPIRTTDIGCTLSCARSCKSSPSKMPAFRIIIHRPQRWYRICLNLHVKRRINRAFPLPLSFLLSLPWIFYHNRGDVSCRCIKLSDTYYICFSNKHSSLLVSQLFFTSACRTRVKYSTFSLWLSYPVTNFIVWKITLFFYITYYIGIDKKLLVKLSVRCNHLAER